MPTRMLRDSARASKKLARVNAEAERLYWRLLMVADDFGRFDADPVVIRALCFPRHGNAVTDQMVRSAWLDLTIAGLMLEYEINGDAIGQFAKWDQRIRPTSKSRFPAPAPPLAAGRGELPPSAAGRGLVVDVDVVVDEVEDEGGGGDGEPQPPAPMPTARSNRSRAAVEEAPVCTTCVELLALLEAVQVFFAPGEALFRQVHQAHESAGAERSIAAVREQVRKHEAGQIPKRFLAPKILFDPKNWQVTVNATADHPPIERAERV